MSTTNKNNNSRRDFLKKGITGITGAALLPTFSHGDETKKENDSQNKPAVIKRTLGRTGLKVPVIGIGATSDSIISAGLDAGAIFLDTANSYGKGKHETILGGVLKGRPRDSYVLCTKIVPILDNLTEMPPKNLSAADLKKDFRKKMEQSLARLNVDYVDILYLHCLEIPDTLKHPIIKEVMLELKKEGKTRFLGTSFHKNEVTLIHATVDEKIYDVVLTSYNFRQPHWKEVSKELAYAAKAGLGTVGMKVMAGSFWDKERKFPINPKASLKWCLQDSNLHTTIPRMDTFDQLETNISVMKDLTLTEIEKGDLKFLEKTEKKKGQKKAEKKGKENGKENELTGLYCAQCDKCRSQCRYNLEIPTIMRSYMYAYGYRKPAKAKDTLQELNRESISCKSCGNCAVTCTMGFDVPEKIHDITRVLDVPGEFLV
ncbi:MAG: hypothetical protein GY757_58295 [bacterium]|nr:hypothetical protein [bacterium]